MPDFIDDEERIRRVKLAINRQLSGDHPPVFGAADSQNSLIISLMPSSAHTFVVSTESGVFEIDEEGTATRWRTN